MREADKRFRNLWVISEWRISDVDSRLEASRLETKFARILRGGTDEVSVHGKPPRGVEFLLLRVPNKDRECLLGDLEEEYRTVVLSRHGTKEARLWYRWQVTICVGPFGWRLLKKAAGLVAIF